MLNMAVAALSVSSFLRTWEKRNQYSLKKLWQPSFRSYYLDLLTYRSISNEVAVRFGVEHQSPQLLLIQDGKCVFGASHGAIDVSDLRAKFGVR